MKANFEINLPSIPGKNIKFKIQDIKSAAFGTQKARFPDDKTILTKKFVDSFQNFHEKNQDDEIETQPQTQLAKSYVSERKQAHFRPFVSDNKKFLLPIYAQLKKQQTAKIQNSLNPDEKEKQKKGFSFSKAGLTSFENVQQNYQNQQQQQQNDYNNDRKLTDNYYFTSNQKQLQNEKQKKPRPSAVFKTQTRKKVYDRIYSSVVPGPGAYITNKPKQKIVKTNSMKKQEIKQNGIMDYKHLKDVITKVLIEQSAKVQQQQTQKKQVKPDHMFILDDKDRFGQQIFPIAPKLKVPGPGSYNINNTLEQKAKKLLLVQEQRKLLKQWFNN